MLTFPSLRGENCKKSGNTIMFLQKKFSRTTGPISTKVCSCGWPRWFLRRGIIANWRKYINNMCNFPPPETPSKHQRTLHKISLFNINLKSLVPIHRRIFGHRENNRYDSFVYLQINITIVFFSFIHTSIKIIKKSKTKICQQQKESAE